jgi:hypothetical protein
MNGLNGCIEYYPIIEQAIEFGVAQWGKKEAMAIQIAYYWILGWLSAKEYISDEDRNAIEQGVRNYYFI